MKKSEVKFTMEFPNTVFSMSVEKKIVFTLPKTNN